MSNFEPPTGPPQGGPVDDPVSEAIAQRYLDLMNAIMANAGEPRQSRVSGKFFRVYFDLSPSTALAVCAAANYMDQSVVEVEEANEVAYHLFEHLAGKMRDLLLPTLSSMNLASSPEVWTASYEAVEEQLQAAEGGDDSDLEGA